MKTLEDSTIEVTVGANRVDTGVVKSGAKTFDVQGNFTLLGIAEPSILTFNRMAQDTTGTDVLKAGYTATHDH